MNSPIAQNSSIHIGDSHWSAELEPSGVIKRLGFRSDEDWIDIRYRKGEYTGFRWYLEMNGQKQMAEMVLEHQGVDSALFKGSIGAVNFKLQYHSSEGDFSVTASAANTGRLPFQPQALGLITGMDTYMERFPDWNHTLFPTLLRCEPTHFWGYCMRPDGVILGLASSQPMASWQLQYNVGYMEGDLAWGGHRVETFILDCLHAGPLPERHPQHLFQLLPGEEKQWSIRFRLVEQMDEVLPALASVCPAPFIEVDRTTLALGESARLIIHSGEPVSAFIWYPDGQRLTVQPEAIGKNKYEWVVQGGAEYGHIQISVENRLGKRSEAIISVRPPWSWFMNKAREAAFHFPPRATSHCESWYGLYTLYLAEQFEPNPEMLSRTEQCLDAIYPLMFDMERNEPLLVKHRIQNVSTMVGILVDRYETTGNEAALEKASALADWLIDVAQHPDGSFRAGNTHYTSVIYPAKSIMELILAEQSLAKRHAIWKTRFEKHAASVRLAMDELVRADGDIDTEGELTYEDGMISCSALQLGLFALMQPTEEQGEPYAKAALKLLTGHNSLTNLLIADGRQRGATRRFWESQYDVAIQPNMLNSPHGWTSWRIYATWYAYLLTEDVTYLLQTMNAVGSTAQMVDMQSGQLHWAFVPDPYIRARQISKPMQAVHEAAQQGHHHTMKHPSQEFVIGEQYIDMISDWHEKSLQDNDVHEHFKCLAEVALDKAYVAKDGSGGLVTWNCTAHERDGIIYVQLTEPRIRLVHMNAGAGEVCFRFDDQTVQSQFDDTCWITQEGRIIRHLYALSDDLNVAYGFPESNIQG
ncbi:hypothetical protein AWU65_24360 [Paenibacillus glucanolyticus]|uniref:Uncharacterized protein n=1 Tax=Paenibacillus glucanolyticus TaxID=59843 RepID=A0A163M8Q8_9BACL|nr:hypothetical protein [Paenibacillus glucanolyticus]KZS48844.1 hypothetical protein AWU65_24360 [Paenibacillus glucanolyticus]